jgi:hypothetical protein
LNKPESFDAWRNEKNDTIMCINVLENLDSDEETLCRFHETLTPGGHCIVVPPSDSSLYNNMDKELGRHRRYSEVELRQKMARAGFQVVYGRQFCKVGALAWMILGRLLRRRHVSPRQMIWFDRLWPIIRLMDHILPTSGLSMIIVGKK